MTKVIGLTGGIATGKSTVANFFREQNIPVIDADVIAKEAVEPGQYAYNQIIETFGEKVLQNNGMIDRQKLGKLIFSDDTKRKKLNNIVHPQVRSKMIAQRDYFIRAKEEMIILDIPLLFESNLADLVYRVVVVYVDPDTQLKRLVDRDNLSKEDAQNRIQAQMPIDDKKDLADRVIDNTGSIEYTKKQCKEIIKQL
ncbi:dephospho-CoA kinase [Paraliobacillus quinghaiensis]|uniref:Dephospho-CoA kinase n=1 Tax=Paraliobacillus quinghaiensis TaxID=470815 RepID=A0A917TKQ8_9BACI|nr:dephospho-CoA kinase [Paraliobacillus quinghaiensis]GGM26738.1 dephospho-CoA kinase [Paraliobacillus quinghaiensis]